MGIIDDSTCTDYCVPEPSRERVMRRLHQAVDEELGIESSLEQRTVSVLTLMRAEDDSIRFPRADGRTVRFSMGEGSVSGEGMTTGMLQQALEVVTNQSVVDSIHAQQRFNIDLQWEQGNLDDLRSTLAQKGVSLIRSKED